MVCRLFVIQYGPLNVRGSLRMSIFPQARSKLGGVWTPCGDLLDPLSVGPHVLTTHVLCSLGPPGSPLLFGFDDYLKDRVGLPAPVSCLWAILDVVRERIACPF